MGSGVFCDPAGVLSTLEVNKSEFGFGDPEDAWDCNTSVDNASTVFTVAAPTVV
jgi:hypothetical protein